MGGFEQKHQQHPRLLWPQERRSRRGRGRQHLLWQSFQWTRYHRQNQPYSYLPCSHQVEAGIRDNLVFRFNHPEEDDDDHRDECDDDYYSGADNAAYYISRSLCLIGLWLWIIIYDYRSNSTDSRCSSVEGSRRNSKVTWNNIPNSLKPRNYTEKYMT